MRAILGFFGSVIDSLSDVVFWRRLLHNDARAKRRPRLAPEEKEEA